MTRIDIEDIKYILRESWKEIVYLIVTVIYLIFLNRLNHILLSKFNNNDYFDILKYNNYETIIYFVIAIVLFFIGTMLIIYRWKEIRDIELEFEDIILNFIIMFILCVLMILIVIFINNPILRAVLVVGFVLYAYCSG